MISNLLLFKYFIFFPLRKGQRKRARMIFYSKLPSWVNFSTRMWFIWKALWQKVGTFPNVIMNVSYSTLVQIKFIKKKKEKHINGPTQRIISNKSLFQQTTIQNVAFVCVCVLRLHLLLRLRVRVGVRTCACTSAYLFRPCACVYIGICVRVWGCMFICLHALHVHFHMCVCCRVYARHVYVR